MTDYSKGKIYKIVCNETGEIYVGSTTKTLNKRLGDHKSECRTTKSNISSRAIIERDNYQIELIEHYPSETKLELHKRERYWIDQLNCINRYIPTRTKNEWIDANKDKVKEHEKRYYENNKDKIKERESKYIECECGLGITTHGIARHKRTLIHYILMI